VCVLPWWQLVMDLFYVVVLLPGQAASSIVSSSYLCLVETDGQHGYLTHLHTVLPLLCLVIVVLGDSDMAWFGVCRRLVNGPA
jgi:hypothetical protein